MTKKLYEFVDHKDDNPDYVYFDEDVIVDENPAAIALCILSAINVGTLKSLDDLEDLCDLTVRSLDELIDYQEYPIKAAEKETKARRSLGIGYIGLAHYLAKCKVKYDDPKAWQLVHDLSEAFQYYLLKASNNLAKEKGACEYFHKTKYSQGILPIDTYKKDVDAIVPNRLKYDWEQLRSDILKYGLRHSTLSAQMPCESCLHWEQKVLTTEGYLNFHEICELNHISWKRIELNNAIGWFTLEEPLHIETLEGIKIAKRIYFNGHKEVITITLSDDKVIKCTPNHKFLIKATEFNKEWKHAHELNDNDNIVNRDGFFTRIKSIKYTNEVVPTYDIEVNDVHYYITQDVVSHNSSVVSNATNGIEPPRGYLSVKKSKKGPLKQIVPQYHSLKKYYTLLWDMPSNFGYLNIVAVMQKFFDQSISANHTYNPTLFKDNEIPMSVLMEDMLYTYKTGIKTVYYTNTYDYKVDPSDIEETTDDCESCKI